MIPQTLSVRRLGGRFSPHGVGHMLLAVPREEAHKLILSGMTRCFKGEGPVGVREMRTPHASVYASRAADHYDLATSKGIPAKSLIFLEGYRGNAFVNQGLQDMLDSGYGDLVADRITHIGLSADDQAVTAATTSLDPAGGATGTSIKVTANTARANQTVSCDQTWTQADVAWAIRKIGLLSSVAATDVCNIIGGTAGVAPYNEPFNIDLTTIATWTLTMGVDTTGTAS